MLRNRGHQRPPSEVRSVQLFSDPSTPNLRCQLSLWSHGPLETASRDKVCPSLLCTVLRPCLPLAIPGTAAIGDCQQR